MMPKNFMPSQKSRTRSSTSSCHQHRQLDKGAVADATCSRRRNGISGGEFWSEGDLVGYQIVCEGGPRPSAKNTF